MVYKIDFLEDVYEWSFTPDGADYERVTDYTPTIYATSDRRADNALLDLRERLAYYPTVVSMGTERWRRGFRHEHEPVLRIDVRGLDDVRSLASQIRKLGQPGEYRLYNVDLSREFRYCLERGCDPIPTRVSSTLSIDIEPPELANPPFIEHRIDDETVTGSPEAVLYAIQRRLRQVDPDVLVLSSSELIPTFYEMAEQNDVDPQLGRRPAGTDSLGVRPTRVMELLGTPWLSITFQDEDYRSLEYVLSLPVGVGWLSGYDPSVREAIAGTRMGIDR